MDEETDKAETSEPETITVSLSRTEAGAALAAFKYYENGIEKSSGGRLALALSIGKDPIAVVQSARRKVDEAGCAAWGGEPETDYDALEGTTS